MQCVHDSDHKVQSIARFLLFWTSSNSSSKMNKANKAEQVNPITIPKNPKNQPD